MFQIQLDHPLHVYFIGIGGISMSGLAEILHENGFTVSGSDSTASAMTERLSERGISVAVPQAAENIPADAELIVYTAAIHPDNPEFIRAKELGLPMLSRAELLGEIMENYPLSVAVAGTHGKTTTTSMLAQIFLRGEKEPTISVGGILQSIGSNVHVGTSDLFVTEACEYTNSFLSFYPRYSIILNIEEDHLDFFKDIHDIRRSFRKFAENTKSGGALFLHAAIEKREELSKDLSCRVYTFGLEENADCHPADIAFEHGCASFTPVFFGEPQARVTLSVPGTHNIINALAAIAVSRVIGIPQEQIADGLSDFHGANRRFQRKGTFNGIPIIDDYAHHPTEIATTIQAARQVSPGRLVVVFQPHTYSRTKALFSRFVEALSLADMIVLADIYAARETDTLGMSSALLRDALADKGKEAYFFPSFEEIENFLKKNCMHDDMLITMGAGNVFLIGERLAND